MSAQNEAAFKELQELSEIFQRSSVTEAISLGMQMSRALEKFLGEKLEGSTAKPKFGVEIENKYTI